MLLPRGGLAAGREDGMALDPKAQAALALHRFGLGPRAGSIASIASDPRGALLAELDRPGAGRNNNPELLTSGAAARTAFAYQQAQRAARQAGNLTGVNVFSGELTSKRLEQLREIVPVATRVSVLVNPTGPNAETTMRE